MGARRRVNSLIRQAFPEDTEEQDLIQKALGKAFSRGGGINFLDSSPIGIVHRNLGLESLGSTFRKAHKIMQRELRLNSRQIAFGQLPDAVREEYAMFCHLMYLGFQKRFLNRHPDEEPEEFLERPRKTTMNLTRLIINLKSNLYTNPPIREVDEEYADKNPDVAKRLGLLWSDIWNLTLQYVDRMTRLMGTVSVRPMIDEMSPGGIKLWVFLPSQLRVIPHPEKPWIPMAVIERHDPENPKGRVVIWTDKAFVDIRKNAIHKIRPNNMGRIPHTFFKNELSFQAFFVEGIGRGLCDENATINDKLSDLNEVVQMQGFGYTQVFNPTEDKVSVGPRRATVFETTREQAEAGIKQGVEFADPGAPITEVRMDSEADISNLFKIHRIPDAAVGVDVGRKALSGIALKVAFAPLFEDLSEREKLFRPPEMDLADNALSVLNEHEKGFTYDRAENGLPDFTQRFQEPSLPIASEEQLLEDEFEIVHGITTPAIIIRRKDPTTFDTHDAAVEQWQKNLDEIRTGGPGGFSEHVDDDDDSDETGSTGSLVADLMRRYGKVEDGGDLDEFVEAMGQDGKINGTVERW